MSDWFSAAIGAWFGWKVAAPLIFGALLVCIVALLGIPKMVRQARCKHEKFHETMACDAVCSRCGKNLGFIGTVREAMRPTNGGPDAE